MPRILATLCAMLIATTSYADEASIQKKAEGLAYHFAEQQCFAVPLMMAMKYYKEITTGGDVESVHQGFVKEFSELVNGAKSEIKAGTAKPLAPALITSFTYFTELSERMKIDTQRRIYHNIDSMNERFSMKCLEDLRAKLIPDLLTVAEAVEEEQKNPKSEPEEKVLTEEEKQKILNDPKLRDAFYADCKKEHDPVTCTNFWYYQFD
ncbi:MAG: hypothetical protein MRY83_01940 [Flavobacteriales bacterium]|nr:hypothetical protein [Flavobacteriales bacterium]